MNTELIEKCNLLIKNRDIILTAFKWDSTSMTLAGSSLYVGMNKEADPEKLRECNRILKDEAGVFSEYRGNSKVPLLCNMAVAQDPVKYFEEIKSIVDQMKPLKWISGDYKVLAAMTIHSHTEPSEYPEAISRMTELYHGMKDNHPWLTSSEDIPFAAMLAVSGMDTDTLIKEMEDCFTILKEYFPSKDALQSLSHVLSVDKSGTEGKCRRVEEIFDMLKEDKHKFGIGHELAVLGTLCLLDLPVQTIVDEIIEADDFLKKKTGFGDLSMGSKTRRMYAALMVMDTHMPPASITHEGLLDSVLVMVIAMEICEIVMITSLCATVSASH